MTEEVKKSTINLPINFPKFEDIPVSTKTFIIMTNLTLNLDKLRLALPITKYIVVPKRRGSKKKISTIDPNKDIKDGAVISTGHGDDLRGVCLKKKKKNGKTNDYFRNSLPVVMIMDGKKINFKICRNGKFQMTGCKLDRQAENCIRYIWEYIKDNKDIYELPAHQPFRALFIPAMRNIDFSLGFILDREKLDEYFQMNTDFTSLFETSIGYTGVNIKIPVSKPITEVMLKELSYRGGRWLTPKFVSYNSYLMTLKPKEQQKRLDKVRHTTFLVFHSGKTICSSMCEDFARDTYYKFIDIIRNNYQNFEEKLIEDAV